MPPQSLKLQDWNPQRADPAEKQAFESLPNTQVSDSRQSIGQTRLPPGQPPLVLPGETDKVLRPLRLFRGLMDRFTTLEGLLSARPYINANDFRIKADFDVVKHVELLCDVFHGIYDALEELELNKDFPTERCTDRASFQMLNGEMLAIFRRVKNGDTPKEKLNAIAGKVKGALENLSAMKKRKDQGLYDDPGQSSDIVEEKSPRNEFGALHTITEDDPEEGDANRVEGEVSSSYDERENDNEESDHLGDDRNDDGDSNSGDGGAMIVNLQDAEQSAPKTKHVRHRKRDRPRRKWKLSKNKAPARKLV